MLQPTQKWYIEVESVDRDKHSSLLHWCVHYWVNLFYCTSRQYFVEEKKIRSRFEKKLTK
jgi:hypothetical protein